MKADDSVQIAFPDRLVVGTTQQRAEGGDIVLIHCDKTDVERAHILPWPWIRRNLAQPPDAVDQGQRPSQHFVVAGNARLLESGLIPRRERSDNLAVTQSDVEIFGAAMKPAATAQKVAFQMDWTKLASRMVAVQASHDAGQESPRSAYDFTAAADLGFGSL